MVGRRGWEYWTVAVPVPPGTSGRPLDEDVIDGAVVSALRTVATDGWLPHGPTDTRSLVATGAIEITRRGLREYVTGVRIQVKRRMTR